jgi:Dolichyl-phosphate-mannose-protein mannosyltransferase
VIKPFHLSNYIKIFIDFCKKNKLLTAILLAAFAIRIIPILWGVPLFPYVKNYHPDEPKIYIDIINFPRSYFTFEQFSGYGTFIQDTLGFLFIPLKLLKLIVNNKIYEIAVIIFARLFNAAAGTAAILFTYFLGIKIFDKKTALFASAFLAFSFYHVMNSAIITLDIVMSLVIVINFLLTLYAVNSNHIKPYIFLGIASGILLSTKITGGLFLFVPVLFNFLLFRSNVSGGLKGKDLLFVITKNLAVYILVAVLVFLLFNSYVYLYPFRYLSFLLDQKKNLIDRSYISIWQTSQQWMKRTEIAMGFPITLLFIAGLALVRKKHFKIQSLMILFIFAYYAFWRWSILPRYIISIAPIICLFAANSLTYLYEKQSMIIKGMVISITAVVLCYSGYLCFSGIKLRFDDTRTEASKYIDNNIKEGSSIGVSYVADKFSGKYHDWRYPEVNFNKFKNENFLNKPDIIILSSNDFYQVDSLLHSNKLNNKYELNKRYYREWYRYSPPSPQLLKFYDELLNKNNSGYILIKTFKKKIFVPVEFPPPEVRIYKKLSTPLMIKPSTY